MIGALTLLVSFTFSLATARALSRLKRLRYFSSAVEAYNKVQVPGAARTKGDIRRLRKYRALYKSAKRRILLLLIANILIFMLFYLAASLVMLYFSAVFGTYWARSPVLVPLFSTIDKEGNIYVHVFALHLIGFALPLHFISKAVRLAEQPPQS